MMLESKRALKENKAPRAGELPRRVAGAWAVWALAAFVALAGLFSPNAPAPAAEHPGAAKSQAPPLSALELDLRQAAAAGDAKRTAALLKQGANPNSADSEGVTALMIALVGDVERVRAIAEKGVAGAWQKGLKKVIRAMRGDLATARALLDHGANVNAATPRGITPLALACLGGKRELVSLLLERGAEVDARAKRGETALMVASVAGHNPIVTLLLEHGADPTLQSEDGITAVVAAILGGHPDTAQLLTKASPSRSATF
jgi:hypothetical protein